MTSLIEKKQTPGLARNEGFSLIEMIVAVAIFAVVMTIAVGSLVSIINANKKAQVLKVLMNNVHFAVDDISRNIRVGDTYHCGQSGAIDEPRDCAGGESFIAFEPINGDDEETGDQWIYRLNNGTIQKSVNGGSSYIDLTPPQVDIQELAFYVINAEDDASHPAVLIVVKGHSVDTKEIIETEFSLQTMVSRRHQETLGSEVVTGVVPQNPICPFNEEVPGRIIVNFEEIKTEGTVLYSEASIIQFCGQPPWNPNCGFFVNEGRTELMENGPFDLITPIPPGSYNVTIASFDNHCNEQGACHPNQTQERYFITLLNSSGVEFFQSGATDDLPTNQNINITQSDFDVLVSDTGVQAKAYTAPPADDNDQHPFPMSIVPSCAAFDANPAPGVEIDVEEF